MLDIKYRFTRGDSDITEIIKKCQNIMMRIVIHYALSIAINQERYLINVRRIVGKCAI